MFPVTSDSEIPINTDTNMSYGTRRSTSSRTAITTDANMAYGTSRGTSTCKLITLHNYINAIHIFPVLGVRNPAATDDDRSSGCYENDEHLYDYVDKL